MERKEVIEILDKMIDGFKKTTKNGGRKKQIEALVQAIKAVEFIDELFSSPDPVYPIPHLNRVSGIGYGGIE